MRSRLCSAPLLPFSWLAGAPACLCEKAAIKQTQQAKLRSREFHSLPNKKRCGAVEAASCRKCGEGSLCLLCGAGISGSKPAAWLTLPGPKDSSPDISHCKLGYVRCKGSPTEKSWQDTRTRISTFSFSINTTGNRQSCHVWMLTS